MTIGDDDADPVIDLDHHGAEFIAHRHERYAELRDRCPVVFNEAHGGYWLVTDHASVTEVARDNETFAHRFEPESADGIDYGGICGIPRPRGTPRQGVAEIDGPDHAALRRLLNPLVTPRQVERLGPRMAEVSTRFLDEVVESGRADLVLEYATPVPAVLTLEMMGMPSANWAHYADFFHAASSYGRHEPEFVEAMGRIGEMWAELADFAQHRRDHPADDVTTALVTGDLDGRPLSDDEVVGVMWNLVAGGLDTTTSLVSWALYHLGTHPEDRRRLVDEPALLPTAIEEFLRHFSPNETLTRTITRDVELSGRHLARGDRIMTSWVSANHDEAVFDRPDEVVIDRVVNRHLAFGLGGHRCIGSHLARAEATVMLGDVLRRLPDYVVDEEAFRPYPGNVVMTGVVSMPVTFSPTERVGTPVPQDRVEV
jgi:cytochrome P450